VKQYDRELGGNITELVKVILCDNIFLDGTFSDGTLCKTDVI
jgi:hypothetical protein